MAILAKVRNKDGDIRKSFMTEANVTVSEFIEKGTDICILYSPFTTAVDNK